MGPPGRESVVVGCHRIVMRSIAVLAAAFALSCAAPVQPASAQNLLQAIFGGFDRAIRGEQPRAMSYADHYGRGNYGRYDDRRERRVSSSNDHAGPSSGYCVRTCDGKYFAVRGSGNMSATALCRAFCPAAQTKVFGGGKIDYSTAADGTRYAELPNAFLYRERTVPGCTCNGRTAGGLVPLDPQSDPTLKSGDIIATNDGFKTYSGGKSKGAEFTPIREMSGSSEWRRRLMSIKITPRPERTEEPEAEKVGPSAQAEPPRAALDKTAERLDLRRAQR